MTIAAVIFDWGGVLIENPAEPLAEFCAQAFGVPVATFLEHVNPYIEDFQTGAMGEDELWPRLAGQMNVAAPDHKSLWYDAFQAVYRPQEGTFAIVRRLKKAGLPVGLLSNTEAPAVRFLEEQHAEAYRVFDVRLFSCRCGCVKPKPEIYDMVLEQLGVAAEETVFVDDRADFIAGAQAVGLQSIQFQSSQQVAKELTRLGALPQ